MRSSYKLPSTERVDFLSSFFRFLLTHPLVLSCSHVGIDIFSNYQMQVRWTTRCVAQQLNGRSSVAERQLP